MLGSIEKPEVECGKDKICKIYETDNTPIIINGNHINFLMMGCWGVYGADGYVNYSKTKFKNDNLSKSDPEKLLYGAKRVSDAMIRLSKQGDPIHGVILAGDNVYSKNAEDLTEKYINDYILNYTKHINEEDKLKPEFSAYLEVLADNFKAKLHDFNEQYKSGFLNLINKIDTNIFMAAIGNHDASSCEILNDELKKHNNDKWNLPGLSYSKRFVTTDNTIVNLIFMDTNVYEEDSIVCDEFVEENGKIVKNRFKYPKNYNQYQLSWIEENVKPGEINILIGHIPYLRIPHKQPKGDKKKDKGDKKEGDKKEEDKEEKKEKKDKKEEDKEEKKEKKEKKEEKKDKDPMKSYYVENFCNDMEFLVNILNSKGKRIDLYMCADEHNQQLLYDKKLPPIAILGSGGNQLDPLFEIEEDRSKNFEEKVGKFSTSDHGFLELKIYNTGLVLNYHTIQKDTDGNATGIVNVSRFDIDRNGKLTYNSERY